MINGPGDGKGFGYKGFSANIYASYRPQYTDGVLNDILKFHDELNKNRKLVVDLGCGPVRSPHQYFEHQFTHPSAT